MSEFERQLMNGGNLRQIDDPYKARVASAAVVFFKWLEDGLAIERTAPRTRAQEPFDGGPNASGG